MSTRLVFHVYLLQKCQTTVFKMLYSPQVPSFKVIPLHYVRNTDWVVVPYKGL